MLTPPITYIHNFIQNPTEAKDILCSQLKWEKRDNSPRHEYYCNDLKLPYTYGSGKGQRTYEPQLYHPTITYIKNDLEKWAGCKFEVCFLNKYVNQSEHLGWHCDNSPEMDDDRPIAIISLGAEREIWFRPIENNDPNHITKLTLNSGSLCLMAPGMQDQWQHRIPKASFKCTERISLTFRGYK